MSERGVGNRVLVLGSLLALALPLASEPADARQRHQASKHGVHARSAHARVTYARGLQCVPFARQELGIEIIGNAWTWWDSASGVYQRGNAPEPGSVLAFRAAGAMRLGHVAVVSQMVSPREIEIEHANWLPGRINRGVPVVDVSPRNDWTAVRVELARQNGDFGNIYPTYGFIYDRPWTRGRWSPPTPRLRRRFRR